MAMQRSRYVIGAGRFSCSGLRTRWCRHRASVGRPSRSFAWFGAVYSLAPHEAARYSTRARHG